MPKKYIIIFLKTLLFYFPSYLILRKMGVHLVTVKVSIVGLADGIVQPHHLLAFQYSRPTTNASRKKQKRKVKYAARMLNPVLSILPVGHDGRLVQRGLPVEQHGIPRHQVAVDEACSHRGRGAALLTC